MNENACPIIWNRRFRVLLAFFLAVEIVALDQLSKWFIFDAVFRARVTGFLRGDGVSGAVDPSFAVTSWFNLVQWWNRGISFGLFQSDHEYSAWILMAVTLVIVGILVRWLWMSARRLTVIGTGLVIGGAIGNFIDRFLFGAVRDFLDFHYKNLHWPAFNVADAAIVCGVAVIVLDSLLVKTDETPETVSGDIK